MNAVLNTLERKNVNMVDYLNENDPSVINEIMIALVNEGELNSKEVEAFSYVFDVIKEEYQNIDHSDPSLNQIQEIKNTFSKNRLDFCLGLYSKFISSYGAAAVAGLGHGFVLGGFAAMAIIPTIITPVVAKRIKYNEYAENKKYGAERIVKDFLHKTGVGKRYVCHGKTFNRMDAYRRKITYFKETVASRMSVDYNNDQKILKGLKIFLGLFAKKCIDTLLFVRHGKGINDDLRSAEKELDKVMGGTKNVKEAFEKINDEMYNEYLSRNIEEYLVYLVNERVELKKQEKELKESGRIQYFEKSKGDIVNVGIKIKENKREIEKISKLRKLNYRTSERDSIYYAGASMLATAVLDEIDRSESRHIDENPDSIKSLVGRGYKREINLEKKKALLRIESKSLAKQLDINPDSNEDLLLFNKCLSVVISGSEEYDIKSKVQSILKNNIENEDKLSLQKIRYSDFIERFMEEFRTYNSMPITESYELDKAFKDKIKSIIEKNSPSEIRVEGSKKKKAQI